MSKTMEKIKANLHQDIDKATTKELEKIYSSLKNVLKTFDRDSSLKNLCDFFKNIFRSKKAKCLQFVNDIYCLQKACQHSSYYHYYFVMLD